MRDRTTDRERGPGAARAAKGGADLIPLIGYVRVSTAREEMISPDLQRSTIKAWCKANGRRIVGWLEDLDLSGREFAKRKIDAGVKAIREGEAAEIGVWRYDRWGRNAMQSLANCHRVEQAGGQVRSATEPFDAETAIGKYSRTNAFALAEMQSDLIGEGWKSAHAHRLERRLPATGRARFGYVRVPRSAGGDGLFRPDPLTGPLLADGYHRYVAGDSLLSVARRWNERGATTTFDGPWWHYSVRKVLDSGFGAGLLNTNRGYLPGAHEPVIDMATWEAYRARRAELVARPPRLRNPTYELSGLLRCGYCGGRATHIPDNAGTPGARVFCSTHRTRGRTGVSCQPLWVPRADVEEAVRGWLRRQLAGSEGGLDAELARARKREASTVELAALERQVAEIDRQLVKLTDGWTRGIVPEAAYVATVMDLNARSAALRAGAQAMADALERAAEPPRESLEGALLAMGGRVPAERCNELLRHVVGKVVVYAPRDRAPEVFGRWETVDL